MLWMSRRRPLSMHPKSGSVRIKKCPRPVMLLGLLKRWWFLRRRCLRKLTKHYLTRWLNWKVSFPKKRTRATSRAFKKLMMMQSANRPMGARFSLRRDGTRVWKMLELLQTLRFLTFILLVLILLWKMNKTATKLLIMWSRGQLKCWCWYGEASG